MIEDDEKKEDEICPYCKKGFTKEDEHFYVLIDNTMHRVHKKTCHREHKRVPTTPRLIFKRPMGRR